MNNTKTTSSFIIQPYRRKWLKPYFNRMSKDRLKPLWDDNVADVLEQQGFVIKESPRSIYRVNKLYEALALYAPDNAPSVTRKLSHGVLLAYKLFARPKDEPYLKAMDFTPQSIWSMTSNKTGSSGLTAWGMTKAESYVRAYERGQQVIKQQKKPEPCIAFTRTQANDKTRLVWGYPYDMTAIEGIFARPLIDEFLKGFTPMAFGMKTGDLGTKLRVSSYHKKYAYSIDMSKYDSSLSSEMIYHAFNILSTWFDMDEIEPTTGVLLHDIWKQIVHYFIYTPIVMPDGNVYKGKKHGVPSGSYFTQMIDSICNVIICGEIADHFNMYVAKEDIFVLGDDLLFWSNTSVDLQSIANYASSLFGVKFNADKSKKFMYNEDVHYLGRDWSNGIPSIPLEDILVKMTQPESFRKYSKDPVERWREVRLLLMSYASTYKDAYSIFMSIMNPTGVKKWDVPPLAYERQVSRTRGTNWLDELDEDKLSGLSRYLLKYQSTPKKGVNPLALQFWR